MRIESTGVSLRRIWASRILTALSVLFLLMDGGMKLFKPPFVIESTARLGYPESTIVGIGVNAAGLHCLVPDTAHRGSGSDFAHQLSWRGGCQQRARRYSTLQRRISRAVRCCGVDLIGLPRQTVGKHSLEG